MNPANTLSKWAKLPIWVGASLGLVFALGLTGVRVVLSSEPFDAEGALGDLAFGVVYVMPFALSLWALRWQDATQQAAVWLAAGALAFLASFSAFSGVSLVFLPTVPLLILGGLVAAARAIPAGDLRPALPILPISALLAAVGVGAFLVLITLTSDPRCWTLNRFADGRMVWERDLASEATMVITRGPNGETLMGGGSYAGPSIDGVQHVSATCTSDVISPIESAAGLGLWSLAIVGLEAMRRFRRIEAPAGVGG